MTDDDIRAAFERWAQSRGHPTKRLNSQSAKYMPQWRGQYILEHVQIAWEAWQAALSWRSSEASQAGQDANVERVRAKLHERSQVGIAKYGVTTERGDLSLRDWLTHLQEELMDAAVYVEAALNRADSHD